MLILGDVLAVVASLVGICLTAWTTLLALSLLFPSRAERAADGIRIAPGRTFGWGVVLTAILGFAGLVLLGNPAPVAKLVGWLIMLTLLSLAALGASGLSLVLGGRVRDNEPHLSTYAALMRGAALVVVPGLLPVLGWFLVAPVVLLLGVGAGTRALRPIRVAA